MNVRMYAAKEELAPSAGDLLQIVQCGLRAQPKQFPSWLFYDKAGSALFERICLQPEYYLTRAEIALLQAHAREIAEMLGPDVRLVEYGSGHAIKTRMLLEQLVKPVSWVPIELSAEPLLESVRSMGERFPQLMIQAMCADFTLPIELPAPPRSPGRTVIYFSGSTIGNFEDRDALSLLRKMRHEIGDGGGILIGVDLKKDRERIEAAYNDRAGVTAAFTLNMLERLNRDLGADFDLSAFHHRARYNGIKGRIETHIVCDRDQQVCIGDITVDFQLDEAMLVECSCKYSLEDFARMAETSGLAVHSVWTDLDGLFSLQYLTRSPRN